MSAPKGNAASLAKGLKAGMTAEQQSLDERFRRADVLLSGVGTDQARDAGANPPPQAVQEAEKPQAVPNVRAERVTFSMTREDTDEIEIQLIRILQETGVRLNKSEVLRLALKGLSMLERHQLAELCLSLNRLNKRS